MCVCVCVFIIETFFRKLLAYIFHLQKKAHLFQFITVYSCHDAMSASNHSRTLDGKKKSNKIFRDMQTPVGVRMCMCKIH